MSLRRSPLRRISFIALVAALLFGTIVATSRAEREMSSLEVEHPLLLIRVRKISPMDAEYKRVKVGSSVNYLDRNGVRKELLDLAYTPEHRPIDLSTDKQMQNRATMAVSREAAGKGRFMDVNLSVKYEGMSGDVPDSYEVKDMVELKDLQLGRPLARTFLIKPGYGANKSGTKLTVEYLRVAR